VGLDSWWQVSPVALTTQEMAARLAPQTSAQSTSTAQNEER
jgi:microcin C transport system substrate-binding protein